MYTVGGRGGKVFVVTSLADSGPGTFREACEAGGPRIVVFNVAGIIKLKERIRIRAPYITISGATAPGDGVCIAGSRAANLRAHPPFPFPAAASAFLVRRVGTAASGSSGQLCLG